MKRGNRISEARTLVVWLVLGGLFVARPQQPNPEKTVTPAAQQGDPEKKEKSKEQEKERKGQEKKNEDVNINN